MTTEDSPEGELQGRRAAVLRWRQGLSRNTERSIIVIGLGFIGLLLALAVVLGGRLSIGMNMSPQPETLALDLGEPSADQWVRFLCAETTESKPSSCYTPVNPAPVGAAHFNLSLRAINTNVVVTRVAIRSWKQPLSTARYTIAPTNHTPSAQGASKPSPFITTTVPLPMRDRTQHSALPLGRVIVIEEGHAEVIEIALADTTGGGTGPWAYTICIEVEAYMPSADGSKKYTEGIECGHNALVHPGDDLTSRAPGTPSATPGLTRHPAEQ